MASATPDLRLPSHPWGITALWPVPNYTAWWTETHVCELWTTCLRSLPGSVPVRSRTCARVTSGLQVRHDKLFRKILHNSAHVLQRLIPDRQPSSYNLRPRSHDKLLLNKTTYLNERDFVIRMLYRESYWCVYLCKLGLCQICYTWLLTICFISCVCQLFLKNKMNEWMNEWMARYRYRVFSRSSKLPADVQHYISWKFAGRLLDRVNTQLNYRATR